MISSKIYFLKLDAIVKDISMELDKKFTLTNKVAIVTGASKGIGKEIARILGSYGANVVVSSRKQEAVDATVEEFNNEGINGVGIAAHMGEMDQIHNLVQKTVEHFGQIDIIVNNAAINPVYGPIVDSAEDAFDKIFQVNVKGPLALCQQAFPYLRENMGSSIVNISSIEGLSPGLGLGLYSMSKSALITLTKVLAREWGKEGIRCNVICPGLVETKFSEALTSNEKVMKYVLAKQALPQVAGPEDIAGLALFLASDAASFCTGGVYTADGGYTI